MAYRTVEEQLQAELTTCQPLDPLELPLLEASGCVLAETVHTNGPVPAFDVVIVDGYAVRSRDIAAASASRPIRLAVVDSVSAGYRAERPIRQGEAIRVSAGVVLPAGADAVIPLAMTDRGSSTVLAGVPSAAGSGWRRQAGFAKAGQVAMVPGVPLRAAQQSALVASGRSRVLVHPAPRVVVVTVGTELVVAGAPLEPGLVHDVNAVALSVAVREAGGVAFRAGPVPDDPGALASMIEGQQVRADLIVLTGGLGDTVPNALRAGAGPLLVPASVAPGPLVAFGKLAGGIPVIAIPGEPVSALINYEIFVRPLIRRLMGSRSLFRPVARAKMAAPVEAPPGVRRFVPVAFSTREGDLWAEPVPAEIELSPLAAQSVTGLAVVPEDTSHLATGTDVLAIMLDRS